VEYDVLAEKLPGYVRPRFWAIIRGSKHSTRFCCDRAQTRTIARGDQALANRFRRPRA
jgi:hypothetical protein